MRKAKSPHCAPNDFTVDEAIMLYLMIESAMNSISLNRIKKAADAVRQYRKNKSHDKETEKA